jgi:predicted aspartyl protease
MLKVRRSIVASVLSMFVAAGSVWAQTTPAHSDEHIAHLDISHGKPFVMVMVNGQGPFRFVIDTGTGGEAFITPQLAAQLSLPQSGQIRLSDPSGKGGQRVPIVLIKSLHIAGAEFTAVKAAVHVLSDADGPCQGLLGFTLFRDYLLTLDYPNRKLKLSSGELTPDGDRSVLPFRMPDGIPIVSMTIGLTRIEALIDSGGTGLSLPQGLASQLQFLSVPVKFSDAHSIATRFQVTAGTLASNVHLGSYTFEHPFVEINPAFPLANFGSCPMQGFVLTFDQKHALVRFEANRQVFHLSATPAGPMQLTNAVQDKPPDPNLVPVG